MKAHIEIGDVVDAKTLLYVRNLETDNRFLTRLTFFYFSVLGINAAVLFLSLL